MNAKSIIKQLVGTTGANIFRYIRKIINKLIWYGSNTKCNICNSKLRNWRLYGNPDYINRICPVCYSFGRQRFLWFCITNNLINIKKTDKTLHIAPELCLKRKFNKYFVNDKYITGDLYQDEVDIKVDITDSDFIDNYFDTIICLHVLEHIPDDTKAIKEFYRILSPHGKLIVQVPLSGSESSFEDVSIDTPELRKSKYGQSDHLRLYGYDLKNKLEKISFKVKIIDPRIIVSRSDFEYFAFDLPYSKHPVYTSESVIILCEKI